MLGRSPGLPSASASQFYKDWLFSGRRACTELITRKKLKRHCFRVKKSYSAAAVSSGAVIVEVALVVLDDDAGIG